MKKEKIYTNVKLEGNDRLFRECSGKIPCEDFELMDDLFSIIWQPDFEYRVVSKAALKKIREVVKDWNLIVDQIDECT